MYVGALLLALSFLPWIFHISYAPNTGMLFAIAWGMGYVIVCNNIIARFTKRRTATFLSVPHGHIFLVGAVAGILIEFFGNWTWKLWYYPRFPIPFYLLAILFILAVYFYFILKGYLAARAILLTTRFGKKIKINIKGYRTLFTTFGLVGSLGFVAGLSAIVTKWHFVGISYFNGYGFRTLNFVIILITCCSLLLVLEYLEYREGEDSFILHILQGDWTPFFIIVLASLFTSVTMEGFNVPLSIWLYTNWPYPHIAVFGLPITVLLAWPIQYVLFISLYRVFYKRETAKIWY